VSFRFRVIIQEKEDDLYSSNTHSNVTDTESGDTDFIANKSIEKRCVFKRRFCREEKFSVLFDFVETHDLCPAVFESVAILLFHPKRTYSRESSEGRLISDDMMCDTLVWVEVIV
jgi:hypothetical protein